MAVAAFKNRTTMPDCHDCGNAVSLTARVCPHCGSFDPIPHQLSRKEQKRLRAEARNDNRLVLITIGCIAIGIVTGLLTGHGNFFQGTFAVVFGILDAFAGPPIAFAVNMLWALRR
jgi:hypothetical protein